MKKIFVFIIITILPHCSFDNKSGIWTSNNQLKKENEKFKDYKTLNVEEKLFSIQKYTN